MEIMLQLSVWRLLNVNTSTGTVVTGDMTAGQLMKLINPLVDDICKSAPIYPALKKLLGDIDHLLTERNKAIHLVHLDRDNKQIAFRIKRASKIQKFTRKSEEELLKIAHQISQARKSLVTIGLPTCKQMETNMREAFSRLRPDETQ